MPERNSYDHLPKWLCKEIDTKLVDPAGKMHLPDLPERVDFFSLFLADLIIDLFDEKELTDEMHFQRFAEMLDGQLDYVQNAFETMKATLVKSYREAVSCSICKERPFSSAHATLRVCHPCYLLYRSEVQLVQVHLYRAKAAGVPATLTLGEWVETLKRFDQHCAYCEGPFEVLEHIIPGSDKDSFLEQPFAPLKPLLHIKPSTHFTA
jgi:hypothetical protein